MKKNISLNMFFALLLQIVTILSGFIIPRLIIQTFGSHINGLISSTNQILNYVTLLEGGVASVMMASLYKPLHEKNEKALSAVVATMKDFFKKLSFIFLVYMFIVACLYPVIVKTGQSWLFVFSLTIILGVNLFVQYNISNTYKLLLNADNKIYLTSLIQAIIVILNLIGVYIGIKIYPNIHVVKAITMIIFFIQPISYSYFVKKYYKLDKKCDPDKKTLSQRWDGFGINLAYFVHHNTDVTLLTIFSTLSIVSVYSVHFLVANGISLLISAILSGIVPTLGKLIVSKNKKELNDFFDYYEFFSFSICTIAFTIGMILITPFIMYYTKGITDANYYQPVFAIIMIVAQMIYCMRTPYINLAYQSGHFKQISKYAYTEAIMNLTISICLISKYGLIGIAIGTLISIIYRTIMQVIYVKKNILFRKISIFVKYIIVYLMVSGISFVIAQLMFTNFDYSLKFFVIRSIISIIVVCMVYTVFTYIFFRKLLKESINKLIRKKENTK